jgi:hypothetical protein
MPIYGWIILAVLFAVIAFVKLRTARQSALTLEEIPDVLDQLRLHGKDKSFAAILFHPKYSLQYSIENGSAGLDWIHDIDGMYETEEERNQGISDKNRVADFIGRNGHTFSERDMNGCKYLRVEDGDIGALGTKIIRDLFQGGDGMELLEEGFTYSPQRQTQ